MGADTPSISLQMITKKASRSKPRALVTRELNLRLYARPADPPVPFLKWAGGKTQLLPHLENYFPSEIESYVEPFVGGGAVFFFLSGMGWLTGDVLLADINSELINAYRQIKTSVDDVIDELHKLKRKHCEEQYYRIRSRSCSSDPKGAARTIYLNKTGFNGLYRVNSKGEFNVPAGRYLNPSIYSEEALRRASMSLQRAKLVVRSFEKTLEKCGEKDLMYIDPPYVPLSKTANFTSYVPGGFGEGEQIKLASAVREADARGARFVLSNSYTPAVRDLYKGFRIEQVLAKRMINSKAEGRGAVLEAVVLNFHRKEEGLMLIRERGVRNGRRG